MRRGILWLGLSLMMGACAVNGASGPLATPTLFPMPTPTFTLAAPVALVTPVIIASPTPAPTQVLHVIEAGDTLIGLAVRYGVSVEALQAANGNVQPEALSIGKTLVIPLSADAPLVQWANQPTPVPIPISPPACYLMATGALYCLAEVHNTGAAALENVTARITLAGADGLPLSEALAQSARDVILPGESAPLAAYFAAAPPGLAAIGATLVSALPLDEAASRYVLLKITAHSAEAAGPVWTVTGEVRNPSGTLAANARLVATLYGVDDAVLGYRALALEGGLAPGETRAFVISVTSLAGEVEVARYTIAAEGRP